MSASHITNKTDALDEYLQTTTRLARKATKLASKKIQKEAKQDCPEKVHQHVKFRLDFLM